MNKSTIFGYCYQFKAYKLNKALTISQLRFIKYDAQRELGTTIPKYHKSYLKDLIIESNITVDMLSCKYDNIVLTSKILPKGNFLWKT